MLIDLHLHSSHSPGVPFSLEELVARIKNQGLDGFCLTDVHTVCGAKQAKQLARDQGLLALIGFEAQTDCGHYLVFVPDPESLPEISTWLRLSGQDKLSFSSLVPAIEEQDGILVAAHPYDRSVPESPGDALVKLEGVSAIEVLNANCPLLANQLAEEIAAGVGLPGVGGSDVRSSLDNIGRFATLMRGPVHTEADLIDRVRSYDVWPAAIGKPAFPESEPTRRDKPMPKQPRRHQHPGPQDRPTHPARARRSTGQSPSRRPSKPRRPASAAQKNLGSSVDQDKSKRRRPPRRKPPPPKPEP